MSWPDGYEPVPEWGHLMRLLVKALPIHTAIQHSYMIRGDGYVIYIKYKVHFTRLNSLRFSTAIIGSMVTMCGFFHMIDWAVYIFCWHALTLVKSRVT